MGEREQWLAGNRAAIDRRLQWLRAKPDGVLCVEPAGPHFAVVTKRGPHVRLVLVEQVRPQSDLIQSVIDLANPLHLVSPYTQAALLGIAWPDAVRRVYAIGLGGGRVPMVLHHHLPEASIYCTEIEPVVVGLAEKYFGLRQDGRLQIFVADGREWLTRPEGLGPFDLILVDAFLGNRYTPYSLATQEFCQLCCERLERSGVLVLNVLTTDRFYRDKLHTLQTVFPAVGICPAAGDNQLVFAARHPRPPEWLMERIAALQAAHQFSFSLVELSRAIVFEPEPHEMGLTGPRVLSDDEPPLDYFDALPSFEPLAGAVDPRLPCPCGSGKPFGSCHGAK